MSFKYINPGFAKLFDYNPTAVQLETTEKSKTGVAAGITGTNTGINWATRHDDFWGRFDVYLPTNVNYSVYFGTPGTTQKFTLSFYQSYFMVSQGIETGSVSMGADRGYVSDGTAKSLMGIKPNEINSVLIHVHYGTSETAYVDITINNKNFRLTGYEYKNRTDAYNYVILSATNTAAPISNIILSDEEISIKEQVALIPVSVTETEMTENDGIYSANAAGQTILQTPNINSLITHYGANSRVTGIALFGVPAYRNGSEPSKLTSISKNNGEIVEYGEHTLDEDTQAVIFDSRKIETTIGGLNGTQFGWKVGA